MQLETIKQEYEFDCLNRGHSPNTMRAYRTALRQFMEFAQASQVEYADQLTTSVIRAFASQSMNQLSPAGAHARLRVLRSFLRWSTDEGYFEKNPMQRVPLPRLKQKLLDAVSAQDMKRLLLAAQNSATPLKYQALLAVLYDTGLRVSELRNLELRDLLPTQCLMVREGKGGKDRIVPISRPTLKLIHRYMRDERPDSTLPHLFLVDDCSPYSNISLYKLLERLCRRAGTKRYSPHVFRRGFAVNYIRNGGDQFTLMRVLGHTTLTMTNRYAALNTSDVQDVHRRVSPMAALQ
ncbi:tyrosine-type recombinase/integrase [uncultured Deinococcus sp.]|uniref:tyrosine-type recombinase/integrase n=1 Tax=uncultured Deinococcus sp. TaxID=158789 RepID=UPI0025839EDD|nr:tyrosine-type recombinase/integrase [uncultured Deinococcus sp.]